jgi:hypothetical protein
MYKQCLCCIEYLKLGKIVYTTGTLLPSPNQLMICWQYPEKLLDSDILACPHSSPATCIALSFHQKHLMFFLRYTARKLLFITSNNMNMTLKLLLCPYPVLFIQNASSINDPTCPNNTIFQFHCRHFHLHHPRPFPN